MTILLHSTREQGQVTSMPEVAVGESEEQLPKSLSAGIIPTVDQQQTDT